MNEKKCRGICGKTMALDCFYKHAGMSDGYLNICKECKKKDSRDNPKTNYGKTDESYDKTEKGVLRVIYKTQKANSKRRSMDAPNYTKAELSTWMYHNGFKKLYDSWKASSYIKNLKPSIDRRDDFLPYTFDNMRLGTWAENKSHQADDIKNGTGTSGKSCKKICQLSKSGDFIASFVSISKAAESTGIDFRNISAVCNKKRKTTGGFIWMFEIEKEKENNGSINTKTRRSTRLCSS